ncbi:MAG: type II secretion system protein N [Pseudomonadota bacterium]
MKRLPLMMSLLAVIALSASIAFWVLQLYKPEQRPMAAITDARAPDPAPDAAATLFGGQAVTNAPSNYQLTGVVAAGRDSVAILVAEGQPPRALKVGHEIAAGVTVKEVHPKYVMLSEGGVLKRIELATDSKAGPNVALAAPSANQQYQILPQQQSPDAPGSSVPVPSNQPMEVPAQLPQGVPPPPPPTQLPAPMRGMNGMTGQGGQPPTQ